MTPPAPRALDRPLLTAAVAVLGAALLGAVLLATAAAATNVLWALAGATVVAVGLVLAQPSALARLGGVLLLQLTQLGGSAGLSATEVVAGLALVGYLGHWYIDAIASNRPIVQTLFDAAAVTWGTVGFAAAAGLGLLFGPDAYDFRADLLATLPFLFYLPVKDACTTDARGGAVVGGVLVVFGLVSTFQNAFLFRSAISNASALYQIADARYNVGEVWIMSGLMVTLAAAALAERRRWVIGAISLSGILLAGLIVTKSRGFWVSAIFGILAMAVVAPGTGRRRILGYGALGVSAVVALAVAFFGDQLTLVALGVLDRFVSIGSATSDLSIVNRMAESSAIWERIQVNPVLGYGWGVQVTHYSILGEGTRHWAFFHNGYLALWFKTGLWGIGLVLAVWLGGMARAARATRRTALPWSLRATALGAGAALAALTPVSASSNPFSVLDQMLLVTLVLALAHGSADRARATLQAS